jgi:hypothetical protein
MSYSIANGPVLSMVVSGDLLGGYFIVCSAGINLL